MKFWGKRKKLGRSAGAGLSIESLEDRAMMAVIPIASGQTTTFHDADGTQVIVKLIGPGQGSLELVGGVLTGAAIDNLTLTGTSGESKLKISTRGGSVSGTTVDELVITKALNELGALKHLKAKNVDFVNGGQFSADGNIEDIQIRYLGVGASIDVTGSVDRLKTDMLNSNASVEVSETLRRFVTYLLESGAQVSANQIDMLKIKQQAEGATIEAGDGGLARAKIKNIYNSAIASEGTIGDVVVKGDIVGTALVSNIDKGSDEIYGTIDDFVSDHSATGYIQSVKLRGMIGSAGTQRVKIVSSGQVGDVDVTRAAATQGTMPMIWEQAASSYTPLSVIQAGLNATGFSDSEIYIAVFGQEIPNGASSGLSYFLAPSGTPETIPSLTATSTLVAGASTPNLVTLPSYTISQWKDATQTWGSDLVFPTPSPSSEWTGRIVISAGVPVQAQVAANGTISAPSPSDPTDPSTGTFYDFVEFTVTADASGNPSLDADTSQVDSFGMPLALQFFQPSPTVTTFSGTTAVNSATITGITSTAGLTAGQYVVGAGIPAGAIIQSVVPSTMSTTGSITLNMPATIAGSPTLTAVDWAAYDTSFTGTATLGSVTLTNVTNLQDLVLNDYLGTGQPVIASGVLPTGATIVSYEISTQTITLSLPAIASTPAMGSTTFTFNAAGPVGVEATRDEIMSSVNANGLTQFLQQLVLGGNNQARPFLQSSAPFIANGPVLIYNASSGATPITITTTGTAALQTGNVVEIDGVLGNTAANGVFEVASPGANSFVLGSPIANGTYTSGGTWSAITPTTITSTGTASSVISTSNTGSLANGNTVTISGATGNTSINGEFVVSSVVANTSFTLAAPVGNAAYTSGGTWNVPGSSTSTAITSATGDGAPIVITAVNTAGLQMGNVVNIQNVGGNTAANGLWVISAVTGNTITLGSPASTTAYTNGGSWMDTNSDSGSVTGATRGGEVVVTAATTGLANGDAVVVAGVAGNTGANGQYTVSNLAGSTFNLAGSLSTGTYLYGGYWYEPTSSTPVTGASSGAISISTANTGSLQAGDFVVVSGVVGNTAANGVFQVGTVNPNSSFELSNPLGNGGYVSMGTWSLSVTDASTTQAVISTPSTSGLNNGDTVTIAGALGNTTVNGQFVATNVTATSFTLGGPIGSGAYTGGGFWTLPNATTTPITGASNSSLTGPIVIATGNTVGLAAGDVVFISGIQGMSGANGVSMVTAVTANSFTLDNSLGVGTYTGGGSWQVVQTVAGATNNGNPIVIATGSTAGLNVGGVVDVQWVGGNSSANGQFVVTNVTPNVSFTLGSPAGGGVFTSGGTWTSTGGSGSVTGASNGGQIFVTTATTAGLQDGDLVEVTGVLGNTAANGMYYISNVTSTSFLLDGATASGTYSLGGTWKEYTSLSRLVSPKDLVESLSSPEETGSLNNYYNQLVDDFFLNYYTGTINSMTGGGNTFSLVSTASGGSVTYSGQVEQVSISNSDGVQYSGYALKLKDTSGADKTDYNIVYPFFDTNAPSSEVYTPLFGTAAAPTWIVANNQQFESASEMIFACDAAFADNVERVGIDMNATNEKILADLENSIAAAFNRGIVTNVPSTWSDTTQWFPTDGTYNYWTQYWHQTGLTIGDLAYAFPYDDKFGASTNLDIAGGGMAQITLGSWSSTKSAADMTVTSPTTQPVTQQGSVTFNISFTNSGTTPTGTVALFINGIALNSNNNCSNPPVQLVALGGGTATLTVNLPATGDAGNEHTYTVTAVYSGDTNYLPTVASMQLQIAAV